MNNFRIKGRPPIHKSIINMNEKQKQTHSPTLFVNKKSEVTLEDCESNESEPESNESEPERYKPEPVKQVVQITFAVYFLLASVILASDLYRGNFNHLKSTIEILPEKLQCDFLRLSKDYPKQDRNLWISLKVGVDSVLKTNQPNTFLLAYEEQLPKDLLIKIVNITRVCLGNENIEPLMLTHNDFLSEEFFNDYGLAIKKYKKPLEESGIMVIENLNKIPSTVAQAFHTFCDTYSPIVNKAIVFFSLPVKIIKENDNKNKHVNIHYLVQETLLSLWRDELENNVLQPLITRVTEMVLFLNSE